MESEIKTLKKENNTVSLLVARRLTEEEKSKFAEWCRETMLISLGGEQIVNRTNTVNIVIDRTPDGSFPGCNNRGYLISDDEWDAIISEQIGGKQTQNNVLPNHSNGYCDKCHTYCYGDCDK